jgi:nuclear receptor interaction protein
MDSSSDEDGEEFDSNDTMAQRYAIRRARREMVERHAYEVHVEHGARPFHAAPCE